MKGFDVLLIALLFIPFLTYAQQDKQYHLVNVPGSLESVLKSNPTPLARQELGSLRPPGKLKLAAIVASDPISKRGVKGLEVQIEGDDPWNGNRHCKETVYIDEDGLAELERRMDAIAEFQDTATAIERADFPSVALAANTAAGNPKNGVFYVPVEFGSYWSGTRFGVYIYAPYSHPITGPHQTCQFRMPNANISELITLVRNGRHWLGEYHATMVHPTATAGSEQ